MPALTSREDLKNYALRALGAPVIEINVSDDQAEDRIDDALQYYQEFHSDSMVRVYYKHQVTAEDVENRYISLPDSIIMVVRILPIGSASGSSSNIFSIDYQMHLQNMYELRNPVSIVNYSITKQYLALIDMQLNGMAQDIRYSRHTNTLHIDAVWGQRIREGDFIVVEGYQTIDPEDYPEIYNDMTLKKIVVALFKRQWGTNLIKFEGMQLPGGVTLNGRQIYDDAQTDILKLEEEMQLKWEMPVDFFMG